MIDAVNSLNAELRHITSDNSDGILRITMIAHANVEFAEGVTRTICRFIRKLPPQKKLIGIYVMDAILKHHSDAKYKYRQTFEGFLVELFVDTFQKVSFELRKPFHKCRKTWKSIFSSSVLLELDTRIHAIDSAWPILEKEQSLNDDRKRQAVENDHNGHENTWKRQSTNDCRETSNPMSSESSSEKDPLPITDVKALLERIKASGVLNRILNPQFQAALPTPSIDDFSMTTLNNRNAAAIDALHAPRKACSHCGISFEDQTTDAFKRHVDSHIRELLRAKTGATTKSVQWFMPLNAWHNFDEIAEVQKDPAHNQEAAKIEINGDANLSSGSDSSSDPAALSSLNKHCTVCYDKFVEYFDDDEDEWRFQNAVISNGLVVHRSCLEQMNSMNFKGVKKEAF